MSPASTRARSREADRHLRAALRQLHRPSASSHLFLSPVPLLSPVAADDNAKESQEVLNDGSDSEEEEESDGESEDPLSLLDPTGVQALQPLCDNAQLLIRAALPFAEAEMRR